MNYTLGSRQPGSDLPSFRRQDTKYTKTYKPAQRNNWTQLHSSSTIRVLVLLLAIAGLAFTFHTPSESGEEALSSRDRRKTLEQAQDTTLSEKSGESAAAVRPPQERVQAWETRGLTKADPVSATSSNVQDEDRSSFNKGLHQLYEDLPPLQQPTPAVLTGSWEFNNAVYDYAAHHPAAEVLSWENPRLVLFKSFLAPDEVQHLIDVSASIMARSEVLAADNNSVDKARTSYGAWPPEDDVMKRINSRIHRLVAIPEKFGESIYVLRYQHMQEYQGHNDNCMPPDGSVATGACLEFLQRAGGPVCGPSAGGPTCGDRVATFILYLKHPKRGGATVFPYADATKQRMAAAGKTVPSTSDWYCTNDEVLGVTPAVGDAVMFWDYGPGSGSGTGSYGNGTADPSAKIDPGALHSGCPVLEGEKWIATRWMRSSGFDLPDGMRSAQ